jgi:hypothetical protein
MLLNLNLNNEFINNKNNKIYILPPPLELLYEVELFVVFELELREKSKG